MNKKLVWAIFVVLIVTASYFVWSYRESSQRDLYDGTSQTTYNLDISQEASRLVKVDVADWKTYTIPELGIEFRYPAYFGNAIIEKTERTSCPQTKTYQSAELLPSSDYVVSFTDAPKVGTGGSYIEAKVLIAQTENATNYCGLDISTLGEKMSLNPDYKKVHSGRLGLKEEYVSTLYTGLGTDVSKFYSLFFIKRNQMILIQPNITFLPYAQSAEAKEISSNGDIVGFVENSRTAESIRSYLRDFEALAATFEFTN